MSEDVIKIFYSYSRKDLDMRNTLEDHLSALREAGRIRAWHDLELEAGSEWEPVILDKLDTADIILLLVSSNFIASKYCYGTELKRALARHAEGTARVIPIILRPCDWNHSDVPFSKLNVLPTHAKAITSWSDPEEAFMIVAQRIRETVDQLRAKKLAGQQTEREQQLRIQKEAEEKVEQQRIRLEQQAEEQKRQQQEAEEKAKTATHLSMPVLNIEKVLEDSGREFIDKYRLMKERLLNVEYEHWAAGFAEGNNHGRGHITRVLGYLDYLLGSNPLQYLNAYELFLTMMSILYHDIGMLRARKGHSDISKALLEGDTHDAYIINPIDKEIIAAAVVSHSSSKDIAQECSRFSPEEIIGNYRARPAVIAALVRLADELDEDYRRADPILQSRLNPPEESRFFWLFCQRVRGIRPNLVSKRIDLNLALEPEDTIDYGKVPGGKIRHFAAFTAKKLAKINEERVTVNHFLPTELQYTGLHVNVKPLQGHPTWTSPRTFVFNDRTSADMFLYRFPELLEQPAGKVMQEILEHMRQGNLEIADEGLDRLASVATDLPVRLRLSILYDKACICSLRAKRLSREDEEHSILLDQSVKHLLDWFEQGQNGGWDATARTVDSEVHRMVNDGDLILVRKERRDILQKTIPVTHWPTSTGGGGGCVPRGTMVATPEGKRPVESLRIGHTVISLRLEEKVTPVRAVINSVVTSRSPCCFQLNHTLLVTPKQPLRNTTGWIEAADLRLGDKVMNHQGMFVLITEITEIEDYFEVFDLTIDTPDHNYLANGLLCHNKMPLDELPPP